MDEKIKDLVARLELAKRSLPNIGNFLEAGESQAGVIAEAQVAIATQAQEIERLKAEVFDFADDTYTQRDQWRQRAEAAEAEVKRITQMAIGDIYAEWGRRVEAAEARVRELTADIRYRASQSLDNMSAAFGAKQMLIDLVRQYATSEAWDIETEDRDFRQIRYVIERKVAAIEAKTIERAIEVANAASFDEEVTGGQGRVVGACLEIGKRIRALTRRKGET